MSFTFFICSHIGFIYSQRNESLLNCIVIHNNIITDKILKLYEIRGLIISSH